MDEWKRQWRVFVKADLKSKKKEDWGWILGCVGRLSAFSNSCDAGKFKWATWTTASQKKGPPKTSALIGALILTVGAERTTHTHTHTGMGHVSWDAKDEVWWSQSVESGLGSEVSPQWGTSSLDLHISDTTSMLCLTKRIARSRSVRRGQQPDW